VSCAHHHAPAVASSMRHSRHDTIIVVPNIEGENESDFSSPDARAAHVVQVEVGGVHQVGRKASNVLAAVFARLRGRWPSQTASGVMRVGKHCGEEPPSATGLMRAGRHTGYAIHASMKEAQGFQVNPA
jgi:hypothetical protein